jgi:hypothetical protein
MEAKGSGYPAPGKERAMTTLARQHHPLAGMLRWLEREPAFGIQSFGLGSLVRQKNRTELHYGSFSRSVPLPRNARVEDFTASYRDGLLELRVPLDGEHVKPRRVPVQRADV